MAADHAGESPFHSGNDDDDVGAFQDRQIGHDPVRSRHTHVLNEHRLHTAPIECLDRLFRDRQITRSGRDDGNLSNER